jgi:autonomous glycyl radical cofactor GrcA
MQFETVLQKMDSLLWGGFIVVPQDIAEPLIEDGKRRVICTLDEVMVFQCAIMRANGLYFINVGKPIRQKFKLKVGQKLNIKLSKDESEYGMEMAEEFEALLNQDALFSAQFHALTPGKQRSLMYIVLKLKSSEKRIIKSLAIAEHLADCNGKLDFKELNEKIKEINQRYS